MAVTYRWQLRKGGRKLECPRCGQKRFVPYVATADGQTIAKDEHGSAIYGKCDRQDHCGYHLYPSHVSDEGIRKVEPKPKKPLRFYPSSVRVDINTPLFDYAARLLGASRAMEVWNTYKIGRDGSRTVFWQIAKDGEVRTGKSIPYGEDGHRIKTDAHPANWLHCSPNWKGWHDGEELRQCYFGEHLLTVRPEDKVVIVESEKTAALMSSISDGWIWLASGGAQGLKNEDKNKALEGRDVWLMPDNGQYWNWREIADKNGWHIFNELETNSVFDGCDILDLLEAGALGKIKLAL